MLRFPALDSFLAGVLTFWSAGLVAAEFEVTASYLERVEKVQSYRLDAMEAEAKLANRLLDEKLQAELYEHYLGLARNGHIESNVLKGCRDQLENIRTDVEKIKQRIQFAKWNYEIWTIRVAGERGEPVDVVRLAELYVTKWENALAVTETELSTARLNQQRAEEYEVWAERAYKKGYISTYKYEEAVNATTKARNETDLLVARRTQAEENLEQAHGDLTMATRTEPSPH